MKTHLIRNKNVETGILEQCGHLYPVRFFDGDDVIEPMHIAPWVKEDLDNSIPPVLKYLRGDFFCAPFGDSDILPDENLGHGTSANDEWKLIEAVPSSIKFELCKRISGAEVIKEISIREGHPVIYQKHTFIGGQGKIPIGHHAMLRVPGKAYISFSDFVFGGTPPYPVETDPAKGNSVLKYPQQFRDISELRLKDNTITDASVYPFAENHEDLYMIISNPQLPFGWSAASCPESGWLWFSIKNPLNLPNTVIWLSNGGRYYPPFSSRHRNVIGIEETASFFHLGHKASIENNFLNESGYRTYAELRPGETLTIPYLFGAVKIPRTFGRVKSITETGDGIEITDNHSNKIHTTVNLNHIRGIL